MTILQRKRKKYNEIVEKIREKVQKELLVRKEKRIKTHRKKVSAFTTIIITAG